MSQNTSDREIVNSRVFPFPTEKVFCAFSNPESLAKWWGPKDFKNTFHAFDFKTGGQWRFTMHSPTGQDYENANVFSEISRPNKITIEHPLPPIFTLEITLNENPGGTLLRWVQRFETAEMRDKVLTFAGKANEENLDRLASVLSGG